MTSQRHWRERGFGERDDALRDGAQPHDLRMLGRCERALLARLREQLAVLLDRGLLDLIGRHQFGEARLFADRDATACPDRRRGSTAEQGETEGSPVHTAGAAHPQ